MGRAHAAPRKPRRTPATWIRSHFTLTTRMIDAWNDVTRRMTPSEQAMGRLFASHPELSPGTEGLVWQAFLQWVRLLGRGRSGLCQPSVVVDELWGVLAEDRSLWSTLPDQVRVLPRVPVREHRAREGLAGTRARAHADQDGAHLPLVFAIDELTGIADGRLYQVECTQPRCEVLSARGEEPDQDRTCLHGALDFRVPAVVDPTIIY